MMVEEYNPPCSRMSHYIAEGHKASTGKKLGDSDFIEAAKFCRGLVGVVEVPGLVSVGEHVTVAAEMLPKWLRA